MIRHMNGQFLPFPVMIHAFRRDNKGGVNLAPVIEHGDIINQHLGFSRPHLHEQGEILLLMGRTQRSELMLIRLCFKFIVHSLFLNYQLVLAKGFVNSYIGQTKEKE